MHNTEGFSLKNALILLHFFANSLSIYLISFLIILIIPSQFGIHDMYERVEIPCPQEKKRFAEERR